MIITRATPSDLPAILALQKKAFHDEARLCNDFSIPPLRQTLEELETEWRCRVFLKAEEKEVLVGSVRASLVGTTVEIGRLIVCPTRQGLGYGRALLEEAERLFPQAQRAELFTGANSTRNLSFYERHGYRRFREDTLASGTMLVFLEKGL